MDEEVIELEGDGNGSFSEPEPSKTETVRLIQFIFDDKMVEFNVEWTYEQVANMVTNVMKDDGYLWVPLDDENGTGSFVNLNNCTNIKIVEFERELPNENAIEQVDDVPTVDEQPAPCDADFERYLTHIADTYKLDMFGTMFGDKPLPFLKAMLMEKFSGFIDADKAESIVLGWRETAE